MVNYKISHEAEIDLIRIHQFGVRRFGVDQADKYFHNFFNCFELIAKRPFAFEAVDYIRIGYRRCPCGSDTIYFRINNDIVEIMAIVGRQDLNNIKA